MSPTSGEEERREEQERKEEGQKSDKTGRGELPSPVQDNVQVIEETYTTHCNNTALWSSLFVCFGTLISQFCFLFTNIFPLYPSI